MSKTMRELLIGLAGVIVALATGALVILARGQDPLTAYAALATGAFGTWSDFLTSLHNSVPLILTGLAAALAFGSGVMNLGQQGQFLFGALACAVLGIFVPLPAVAAIPLALAVSVTAGVLWAWFPAWLKIRFRMDEFITTLMLNFVALYFSTYVISYPLMDPKAYTPMTVPIRPEYHLATLNEMSELNVGFFLVLAVIGLVWAFARYTRSGYEWRMMGLNPLFARQGGVDIARNLVGVMLFGGALSGLAGGLAVMGGIQHRFIDGISANYAWDGVMIAMIAKNGIIGTVLYALFFGALQSGSLSLEFMAGIPSEFAMVLESLIVLSVIATNVVLQRAAVRWSTRQAESRLRSIGRESERSASGVSTD